MDAGASEGGWRGSEELWLAAAYEALIDGGVEAVKVLPLARRLGLSRTSFYWFFRDREALLQALVARWKERNTGNLLRRAEAPAASVAEAMLNVFDCWLDAELFDSRLEFAMRSWALQSEAIRVEVQEADRVRLAALAAMMARFGHDAAAADVRARTVYLVQIGYISMQTSEALAERLARIPDYVAIFTGRAPVPDELALFLARHGVADGV